MLWILGLGIGGWQTAPAEYQPIFHITGENPNSSIGYFISNCSDQNGDCSDELLLASGDNEVLMFFSGENLDTIPDLIFSETFGFIINLSYGDDIVSHDYGSILITYYNEWSRIYLYNCGSELDTTSDMIFNNELYGDGFGGEISVGDINGDGWNDMVTSAQAFDPGGDVDRGKIYVYYGGTDMDTIPDFTITAANNDFGDRLGAGLAVGDVNGDEYADILSMTSSPRTAWLFYGGTDMDSIADWSYSQYPAYLNTNAAVIPNLNGDQYADILIHDIIGNTLVFFGNDPPADMPDQSFILGFPEIMGDLNNDGYGDFVGNTMTSLIIYHGSSTGAINSGSIVTPSPPYGMGRCGNINGDGFDDIAYYSEEPFYYGQVGIYADTTLNTVHYNPTLFASAFELYQNYPNPFNSSTAISFELKNKQKIELNVYNILGKKIAELFNSEFEAGFHTIKWNAEGIPSGIYFIQLKCGEQKEIKKLLLIR